MSPWLAALVQQLDAGNRNVLNDFWQEVETEGTPLIEPIENDPDHVLVTFLWRAREETKNVVVVGGVVPWGYRSRYHVTSNRRSIIVGGSSLGGLAAAYCGLRRPDIFGNILSQSGSFWWQPKLFWPMDDGKAGGG